jgi:hypothetical protein
LPVWKINIFQIRPQDIQPKNEVVRDISDEHPTPQSAPPNGQLYARLLLDWYRFAGRRL